MVCAIADYKGQAYFCNAVYEKLTHVISMASIYDWVIKKCPHSIRVTGM